MTISSLIPYIDIIIDLISLIIYIDRGRYGRKTEHYSSNKRSSAGLGMCDVERRMRLVIIGS